jgi:hypothetical protein
VVSLSREQDNAAMGFFRGQRRIDKARRDTLLNRPAIRPGLFWAIRTPVTGFPYECEGAEAICKLEFHGTSHCLSHPTFLIVALTPAHDRELVLGIGHDGFGVRFDCHSPKIPVSNKTLRAPLTLVCLGEVPLEPDRRTHAQNCSPSIQFLYTALPHPILAGQLFHGLKDGSPIALSSIE